MLEPHLQPNSLTSVHENTLHEAALCLRAKPGNHLHVQGKQNGEAGVSTRHRVTVRKMHLELHVTQRLSSNAQWEKLNTSK
jgi:hypothetical protein